MLFRSAAQKAQQYRLETYGVIPPTDEAPLAVAYRQSFEAFRKASTDYAVAHFRIQYRLKETITDEMRENWLKFLEQSSKALIEYRERAVDLYESDPKKYSSVGLMLREMLTVDGELDRFDHWSRGARVLLDAKDHVDNSVLLYAGYVGFADCDFELARRAWGELANAGKLEPQEARMLDELPKIEESWKRELELREQDKSKNNPRVEILTTKGAIVVELFEDEAPESVASFIYLVENSYYTRKPFFLVKSHWLAQTGCEKGDGKGNAGFTINSEAENPNKRDHFRGSISMPVGVDPKTGEVAYNSGGSQFYFSYVPLPIVDGRHTVFGRVVSGSEVLGMLKVINLTDEEQRKNHSLKPDTIIRAKVLTKRDHAYRPTPVFGKLPR